MFVQLQFLQALDLLLMFPGLFGLLLDPLLLELELALGIMR